MSKEEYVYNINLELEYPHLLFLYKTIAKSHQNWEGGQPWQQEFLKELRNELWKTVMNAQLEG